MIVLQDVAFSDLHALVEFIYHGEVNVHQRSLSSFLKTAEVLRVSGLTQQADQTDRDEVCSRMYNKTGELRDSDDVISDVKINFQCSDVRINSAEIFTITR